MAKERGKRDLHIRKETYKETFIVLLKRPIYTQRDLHHRRRVTDAKLRSCGKDRLVIRTVSNDLYICQKRLEHIKRDLYKLEKTY